MKNLQHMGIRKIVREFIINNFQRDYQDEISDDVSFLDEGIIDSVGVLELVAFLEKAFNFRIEDEELIPDNLDSVDKLVVFVQSKLPNNRP